MKKASILLTLLVLVLTACGAASTTTDQALTAQESTAVADLVSDIVSSTLGPTTAATSASTGSVRLTTDYENAVPVSMQLVVGILQLEGTDLAITSSQAESFITVLNFLKDLSTNTSATQEQIDALIEQAESILTGEQIAAITNMHITQDTLRSLMQQQGQGNGNPPPQGDMPQGTPPAGGPGGRPPGGDALGTPPADGTRPNTGFVPPQLIDTLIQLMESKIAGS
jgi:predicted outer membrane protein